MLEESWRTNQVRFPGDTTMERTGKSQQRLPSAQTVSTSFHYVPLLLCSSGTCHMCLDVFSQCHKNSTLPHRVLDPLKLLSYSYHVQYHVLLQLKCVVCFRPCFGALLEATMFSCILPCWTLHCARPSSPTRIWLEYKKNKIKQIYILLNKRQ